MPCYYIYCRKSSEAEDRQILSIESQTNELKDLTKRLNLTVIDLLTESKSAKAPGRPVFDEMIKNIQKGKVDGIICWKLDRLARNPIDGGQIVWMLQRGIIKHIQTFDRGYYPEDNVLVMNVEFGMANQYILDLSKNVKRGLKTKVEKGWFPSVAPLGYLNDRTSEKGVVKIIKDLKQYELVKKMWGMMLNGKYSPPKILKIAQDEWGLRTTFGKTFSRSTIYRILSNPFYYGYFEYPKQSGNWYKGAHEPMISVEDYDKVQVLLGRKGRPRPKKYDFVYKHLIKCGECGGSVTAEEKNQIICSNCSNKFSTNNNIRCPNCSVLIEKMEKPTILKYVYYHCIKRKEPKCTQRSIEVRKMEKQVDECLEKMQISEVFKNWAVKYLNEKNKNNISSSESILKSQKKAYDNCLKKINNLFQLKISPLNDNGSLLSDEDYAKQKTELVKEKARLEEMLKDAGNKEKKWLDIAERSFNFACYAKYWFANGTPEEKGGILQALGSNLNLTDKKLLILGEEPLVSIEKIVERVAETRATFEPMNIGLSKRQLEAIFLKSRVVRGEMNNVRTQCIRLAMSDSNYTEMPDFGKERKIA